MECSSCNGKIADDARFCARCGSPAPAAASAAPADPLREILKLALGRQYEVVRLLGKGGMGAVYLATEAALEREVAIKVLPPDRGATQDSRDRFRREARTAAKLSHPNIVPLYTFGDVDGTLYFVMGYVKGESLAARLKREGRLGVEESRRILIELCEALDYAHKLGIVHRDIKPDNVLLEEGTGRVLLTDFGVAKALGVGQTMTEIGSVLGTPHYMSPEQAQGKADIDHRSDIYSLGVMGYAMFAGRLPFEGPTPGDIMVQHITKEPPSLKSLAPDTPVDIASALTRSLAKNPKDRWPDARGLKAAISESNDAPVPAPLLPIWRGTQALAVGGYCTALVWVNAVMTPESTDPLASRLAIDALPRLTLGLTMIGMVGLVGAVFEARKLSHSWVEILHAARLKPAWWLGWYPAHWRARADVWDRLPIELRRARSLLGWGVIVNMVWVPLVLLVSINASNFYRTTGRETVLIRVDRVLKSKLGRGVMAPPIALVALGFFFARRWTRSRTASRVARGLAGEAIGTDTAHRTFWSRPEVAALLLPPGSAPNSSGKAPTSAQEMGAAISAAFAGVGELAGFSVKARDATRDLTQALAALDHQIGALASAVDPAEAKRLVDRIAALGPDRGPNDLNREVREILQKQLDAVRSLESRIEETKSRRAQRFELLKALWVQAVDLRTAAGDAVRISVTTESLRRLLADIETTAGSKANSSIAATEALPEAPTLERK